MKTNLKIKGLAIAFFATIGMTAMAQLTAGIGGLVAPTLANSIDTVTIGSVMPYQVTGDANMHLLRSMGILKKSNFNWVASSGGTLRAETGAAASTPAAIDTLVSVAWATTGAQSVQVTEVPQVLSGPAFSCTAAAQTLPVFVVARPTAALGAAASASGCSVDGTTVTIPYTLTGISQFEVTYSIVYTNLSGVATSVVNNVLVSGISGTSANFSYAVPSTAYGKYDVTISKVSDRISRKSGIVSTTADVPAAALTFYAYPTPVTNPINHVKNL